VITGPFKDSDYPAQLARTFLVKAIKKNQYLLGKNINKLPKSNLFLNNLIETQEEYQKDELDGSLKILEQKVIYWHNGKSLVLQF
jgi:hypothetical protein